MQTFCVLNENSCNHFLHALSLVSVRIHTVFFSKLLLLKLEVCSNEAFLTSSALRELLVVHSIRTFFNLMWLVHRPILPSYFVTNLWVNFSQNNIFWKTHGPHFFYRWPFEVGATKISIFASSWIKWSRRTLFTVIGAVDSFSNPGVLIKGIQDENSVSCIFLID